MELPSSVINLQIILSIQAEIEAIKIEVQGMIAKNNERRDDDMSNAYDDQHFQDMANVIRSLSEQLGRI